jgi:alpha,alpha-trehalase
LGTISSNGFHRVDVRGTYKLANLLQELTVAQEGSRKLVVITSGVLDENPVRRLTRLIDDRFWNNLERRLDESVIEIAAVDPKDRSAEPRCRIYVPAGAPEQFEYYRRVAQRRPEIRLDVHLLPEEITDDVYRSLNEKPGILALEMEEVGIDPSTGEKELRGLPFIVPGGCFNELYNWDSYFIALGLLSSGKVHLAKTLIQNFIFEIQHYGLIPNANRSYYVLRSQPPFLTDLALRTYEKMKEEDGAEEFLKRAILASIKEYHKVWMSEPRLDVRTGLSRYRPAGVGSPPECSLEHFSNILEPYAEKYGMEIGEFRRAYDTGKIDEPELDEYFLHDRGVRESGHDVSLRVENVCADLATIDLNSLLYKYETDISHAIQTFFDDGLQVPAEFCIPGQEVGRVEVSSTWDNRAAKRKEAIDKYLWNEEMGIYLDYNTKLCTQHTYESVTCFYALWCGVASTHQAALLASKGLPLFERLGGLLTTIHDKRGKAHCHPAHQWDYPYGWAPHQIMAWDGFLRYGYKKDAQRLAYKWLYLITKVFVDYNGTVVEKYDVTQDIDPHKVNVDYGNQGLGFKGYAKEGFVSIYPTRTRKWIADEMRYSFGWTNASYVHGLNILDTRAKRALGVCAPWSQFSGTSKRN